MIILPVISILCGFFPFAVSLVVFFSLLTLIFEYLLSPYSHILFNSMELITFS